MGIDGNLWLWFQDYLSGRFQCVCIGSCRSNLLSVLSGVPQGSILGPLLFIVYINDLPTSDTSMLYTFADDTKCLTHANDQCDCIRMQEDLDHICEWSREWKMRFNVPKCVCLSYIVGREEREIIRTSLMVLQCHILTRIEIWEL